MWLNLALADYCEIRLRAGTKTPIWRLTDSPPERARARVQLPSRSVGCSRQNRLKKLTSLHLDGEQGITLTLPIDKLIITSR